MDDTVQNKPVFLTTREVADLLRVKERKVYDLAATEDIPHRRITGKLLFPADEIDAWLNASGPRKTVRPNVVAGSHDPLLDWAVKASNCGLATRLEGSQNGLELFLTGEAALAGLHMPDTNGWNVNGVAARNPANSVLISWAKRARGLLVSSELDVSGSDIAALRGKRLVLRQQGSGSFAFLQKLLAKAGIGIDAFATAPNTAHTESDAAASVALGEADVAVGIEAMANQFKLRFLPLAEECFDLLIDQRAYFTEPVQQLFSFARTSTFNERATSLGGYDLSEHGQVRWLSP
ncbi:helix-turn-helix domain-containing protein [Roseibium denhamense]|uniref:DNA binding domain-containing protein, excisionase family n=1 Tax=Roseibium denhamense TaxID=76305 RepID=A0ABY1PLE8_9HYPH|nr:helix-turn-helix transcriptional regulator [Roseibium denhamense]MTI07005.1 helix-turn-helix domain-containing protein [Roseibium denhamense]SMP36586.1 DNA binding domain-containing protein, excisionase family [Roseibium denhamense]